MPHGLWVAEETWNVLLADNAELARWLSFAELTRIGLLNRSFKRMFERALGFLWRSRSAACARAELSHTVGCAVRFGKTEHVRILMPLLVRAAEAGGGAGGDKSVVPYLFDAIREGHAEVVGALLEIGGPELPMMTDSDRSAITVSVLHRRAEIVGVLEHAMGVEVMRQHLMIRCLGGRDLVDSIWMSEIYPQMSCLHYSVCRRDLAMVNALLGAADRAGTLPELLMLTTACGRTCLHMAVERVCGPCDFEVLQALMQAAGLGRIGLLMQRSGPGDSCLMSAASVGSVDAVNVLLEAAGPARRELIMMTNVFGNSCLHVGVKYGGAGVVKALLEAARPARRTKLLMLTNAVGDSCLHVGAKEGGVDVVKALLEAVEPARRIKLIILRNHVGAIACGGYVMMALLSAEMEMLTNIVEPAGWTWVPNLHRGTDYPCPTEY